MNVKRKIYKINKKINCLTMSFFIYFAYIFTICNKGVTRNKRLDVFIYENRLKNQWRVFITCKGIDHIRSEIFWLTVILFVPW